MAANPILDRGLLTQEQIEDGWISLFDGETLFGWEPNDDQVDWHVEDGMITASEGPIGLLLTTVPYADFEFVCEYRLAEGGNSGVFIRTIPDPQDVMRDCYEINMADTHPQGFVTGSIVGRAPASTQPVGNSWQTLRILSRGREIQVELGGEVTVVHTDDTDGFRSSGRIGLQKNEGKIEFRRVVLKPLEMTTLFGGDSLDGWREVPGSKSEFEIDSQELHVVNGPGFLETEQTFADFLLQMQVRTGAENLNSGVFFRAQPGTEEAPSNGYEMQIHNGFQDGDRSSPMDSGSGAIFRRVPARRVVANDEEWMTMTLVAAGPRMATWVDGYQVVAWEDEREPDENPRRGKRLEAGHVSLQGHDPTTDVRFRQILISTLPEPEQSTADAP